MTSNHGSASLWHSGNVYDGIDLNLKDASMHPVRRGSLEIAASATAPGVFLLHLCRRCKCDWRRTANQRDQCG